MGIIKDLKEDAAATRTPEGRQARKAELTAQLEAKKAALRESQPDWQKRPIRTPKFSQAVEDGRCPKCSGTTFKAKRSGFGKGVGLLFGGIGILFAPKSQVRCEGCGTTFRRG